MDNSINVLKKHSRKNSKKSRSKINFDKQNTKKTNGVHTTCPDLINFIMNKRLELNSFYDQKGSKEFLESKHQALEKIELNDEINESCTRFNSKNDILSRNSKVKGILKSICSSKYSNRRIKKHVSFDSSANIPSTHKNSLYSNKPNFSNKSNNCHLEIKNWDIAKATVKCIYFRKVKQNFSDIARKIFQENSD